MNKTSILLITVILSFGSLLAQERYLVYFKDKGSNLHNKLNKSSAEYKQAEKSLSKKAIERRKKTMGEDYIRYEDLPISSSYIDIIRNFGVEIHRQLKWFNAVSCYLNDEQINQIIILPFVEKIEKVRKLKRIEPKKKNSSSDDSYLSLPKTNYNYNYGNSLPQYELSDVPSVHDAGITGEGVIIGILDSGFRWKTHPALANAKVIAEHDFVFGDDNTANESGDKPGQDSHGTYVMSLIGGFSEGNLIGDSFGSSFILAKTEDNRSETHAEEDNYVAALQWMESIGVDIITSSVGYAEFDAGEQSYTYEDMNGNTALVTKASNIAFNLGICTVTSAGNERTADWGYITAPADAFDIISVGSVDKNNRLSYFSSYGPTSDGRLKPEIVAQGQTNWGADAEGSGYYSSQGTSFSAPIVAGILGLLKSAYPHLNNKQVREIILASGDKVSDPDNDYGYGLVSAVRAVNFPNLEKTAGGYNLRKIFLTKTITAPNSVGIHYSLNGSSMKSSTMSYDGSLKYSFDFSSVNKGDSIEFYFTFNNGSNEERVPAENNYYGNFGSLSISTEYVPVYNPVPEEFSVFQNYPNPFNPTTIIKYEVPERSLVSLKIFDILGQEVKSLINSEIDAGTHTVSWNGTNNFGQLVSAGAYVYQMVAGDYVQSKKMVLLR